MAQVKALKLFRDKDSNLLVNEGDVLTKNKSRAEELSRGGYVEILEDEKEAESSEDKATKPAKAKPSTKEEKKFD